MKKYYVCIWQPETTKTLEINDSFNSVYKLIQHPNGNLLILTDEPAVRVYDIKKIVHHDPRSETAKTTEEITKGSQLAEWDAKHDPNYPCFLSYDPESFQVTLSNGCSAEWETPIELDGAASLDDPIFHINIVKDGGVKKILRGHRWYVGGCTEFSPGRLLSWTMDSECIIWDTNNKKPISRWTHNQYIDGAIVTEDKNIVTWTGIRSNSLSPFNFKWSPHEWDIKVSLIECSQVGAAITLPRFDAERRWHAIIPKELACDTHSLLNVDACSVELWDYQSQFGIKYHSTRNCTPRRLLPNGRMAITGNGGIVELLQLYEGNKPKSL